MPWLDVYMEVVALIFRLLLSLVHESERLVSLFSECSLFLSYVRLLSMDLKLRSMGLRITSVQQHFLCQGLIRLLRLLLNSGQLHVQLYLISSVWPSLLPIKSFIQVESMDISRTGMERQDLIPRLYLDSMVNLIKNLQTKFSFLTMKSKQLKRLLLLSTLRSISAVFCQSNKE